MEPFPWHAYACPPLRKGAIVYNPSPLGSGHSPHGTVLAPNSYAMPLATKRHVVAAPLTSPISYSMVHPKREETFASSFSVGWLNSNNPGAPVGLGCTTGAMDWHDYHSKLNPLDVTIGQVSTSASAESFYHQEFETGLGTSLASTCSRRVRPVQRSAQAASCCPPQREGVSLSSRWWQRYSERALR